MLVGGKIDTSRLRYSRSGRCTIYRVLVDVLAGAKGRKVRLMASLFLFLLLKKKRGNTNKLREHFLLLKLRKQKRMKSFNLLSSAKVLLSLAYFKKKETIRSQSPTWQKMMCAWPRPRKKKLNWTRAKTSFLIKLIFFLDKKKIN